MRGRLGGLADRGTSGRKLWLSVFKMWDLDERELMLLKELVRTVDLLDELQAIVEVQGPMVDSPRARVSSGGGRGPLRSVQ